MKVQSLIFGVVVVFALSTPGFAGYLPYVTHGAPPSSDGATLSSSMLQDNGFPVGGSQEASGAADEEGFGTYYRANSSSASASSAGGQLAASGTFAMTSVTSASWMYAYVPGLGVADVLQETVARAPQPQFRSVSSEGSSETSSSPYTVMSPYSQAAMSPWSSPSVTPDAYEAPAPTYGGAYSYGSGYGSGASYSSGGGYTPASPYSYSIPGLYAYNVIADAESAPAVQFFATISAPPPPPVAIFSPATFIPPAIPDSTGVPEPGTVLLVSSALAAVVLRKRFARS